jgi:hypothetical protein
MCKSLPWSEILFFVPTSSVVFLGIQQTTSSVLMKSQRMIAHMLACGVERSVEGVQNNTIPFFGRGDFQWWREWH